MIITSSNELLRSSMGCPVHDNVVSIVKCLGCNEQLVCVRGNAVTKEFGRFVNLEKTTKKVSTHNKKTEN